jgi:hypothetical protein
MLKKRQIRQQPATGFTLWILRWHLDDNTQIGALARHIKQDSTWPVVADNHAEFVNYLENLQVEERMKHTMNEAWKLYQETRFRLNKRTTTRDNFRR